MKISYSRGTTIKINEMDFDKFSLFVEQEYSKGSISERIKTVQQEVDKEFYRVEDTLKQKAKVNLLKNKVRFYEEDGIFYPSVTSILSFAKGFKTFFPKGYAEAGTILHAYCERWAMNKLKYKISPELCFEMSALTKYFPHLAYELSIVKEENIDIEDLKADKVLEKLKLEVISIEDKIINKEFKYAGRRDLKCMYDGKLTSLDWKSTSSALNGEVLSDYWQQLAAYSEPNIEQLVIVPFDRKLKGIRKPYILPKEKITLYRELFLRKRKKFEDTFNI